MCVSICVSACMCAHMIIGLCLHACLWECQIPWTWSYRQLLAAVCWELNPSPLKALLIFKDKISSSQDWPWTPHIAKDDLDLLFLLPPPPVYWGYWHAPPCLVSGLLAMEAWASGMLRCIPSPYEDAYTHLSKKTESLSDFPKSLSSKWMISKYLQAF